MGCPGIGFKLSPGRGVPLSPTSASGCYIPAGMTGDGDTLSPHKLCGSLRSGPSCPPPPPILISLFMGLVFWLWWPLHLASWVFMDSWINSQQVCDLFKHPCRLYEGLGTQGAAGLFSFHSKSTCCEGSPSHLNCSFHPSHPQVGLLIHSSKTL